MHIDFEEEEPSQQQLTGPLHLQGHHKISSTKSLKLNVIKMETCIDYGEQSQNTQRE